MSEIHDLEVKIKQIIDELKGLCSQNGLSNDTAEEKVITTVFLYKFLNDKFMYNLDKFSKELEMKKEIILKNENDVLDAFYSAYSKDVSFEYEDTIEYLINKTNQSDFYKQFDEALERISNSVHNEIFSIETADGQKKGLFEPISIFITDSNSKNNFIKAIFSIISQEKFNFSKVFSKNFDFFSTIFEYLIKDYNVASGIYAEYFTPQAVSKIIAKILIGSTEKIKASEIYDPAAGSGSLVLHLAHELGTDGGINRALVYSQDISNKSSRFLRINMLLNGMTESLTNVIQGDTLLKPAHFEIEGQPTSGLKKFDYIVSNPPFKMDFSSTRDQIEKKNEDSDRFFAGIPKVPKKEKDKMPIYLLFLQHILYSLKPNGKAAVVVPTGFITAKNGIEKKIKQEIIKSKSLIGCISMPSNIFANTGTNVSVLFFDNAKKSDKVILVDASNYGTKIKSGKNQKTVLSFDEENDIINTFINSEVKDNFSVIASLDEIKEKNYSFSAGHYFDIKIEYSKLTQEEFDKKIKDYQEDLNKLFDESNKLNKNIVNSLNGLNYYDL